MTPIEIIVAIFILLSIVKIIFFFVNRNAWNKNVVKPLYSNPKVTGTLAFVLALIVLYYLIQELTIIQIFGVLAFFALFTAMEFSFFSEELTSFYDKILKNRNLMGRVWFVMLVWIILVIWALVELFA